MGEPILLAAFSLHQPSVGARAAEFRSCRQPAQPEQEAQHANRASGLPGSISFRIFHCDILGSVPNCHLYSTSLLHNPRDLSSMLNFSTSLPTTRARINREEYVS